MCIAAISKPPCDSIHPGASKQQVHKQTLASNKKGYTHLQTALLASELVLGIVCEEKNHQGAFHLGLLSSRLGHAPSLCLPRTPPHCNHRCGAACMVPASAQPAVPTASRPRGAPLSPCRSPGCSTAGEFTPFAATQVRKSLICTGYFGLPPVFGEHNSGRSCGRDYAASSDE